jgi:hypothetical protein
MISTVHLDRHGYVVEMFKNTRIPQLDARKYPGTLMEVTGPVAPGMRWNGEAFVLPPPRIPVEAVHAERDRRINLYFPEAFREQVTAFGGENAIKMQRYLSDLHKTAELMGLDPPRDFKDDVRWPAPPKMEPMPVAQRFHDVSTVSPVSGAPVTIAPVFNVTGPAAAPAQPLVIQSPPAERVEVGGFALDPSDPLYHRKMALIGSIVAFDEKSGGIPDSLEPEVTAAALKATMATSAEDLSIHESRVHELLEAA